MATATATLNPAPYRLPYTRAAAVLEPAAAGQHGLLKLTIDGKPAVYWYREIPSELGGRAFELRKFHTAQLYHVRVGTADQCGCECKDSLYRGHQRPCKHVLALTALIRAGRLPALSRGPSPAA